MLKILRYSVTVFVLSFSYLSAQNYRIILDENYSDWETIVGITESAETVSGIDFNELKVTNYNNFLFLFVNMNLEINIQSSNDVVIYIDTDNNASTGLAINGMGAEIEYFLGDRNGKFYYGNSYSSISHEDIGLITIPTVTSSKFEVEIKTDISIDGRIVFPDSVIKVIVKNNISNGDIIPNITGGYEYHIKDNQALSRKYYSIKKTNPDYLRILTYNVEKDRLFDSQNKEAHKRVFKALTPDIIGFQEIYNHSAQETEDLISEFLPLENGEEWYSAKDASDIIVVSRYPIKQIFSIDGNRAFLLDLSSINQKDLLFISAHTPCCNNEDSRQKEIDHFMAFVRDAKSGVGELELQKDSPIVIVGDMNLVGLKQQQQTLVTGNIINTNLYGESFMPDWDSTYFKDLTPITTNMPSTFTWYDEGSSYSPGRLDYIVFSNSILKAENSFVLFPPALPADTLAEYGLTGSDAVSVADHLPTVCDFSFYPELSVNINEKKILDFSLMQNYPNPFNPSTVIEFTIPNERNELSNVKLTISNILGETITTLLNKPMSAGVHTVLFNATGLPSGVYFYRISVNGFTHARKMNLIK